MNLNTKAGKTGFYITAFMSLISAVCSMLPFDAMMPLPAFIMWLNAAVHGYNAIWGKE